MESSGRTRPLPLMFLFSYFFSAVFFRSTDCTYEALYPYNRETYFNRQHSFVLSSKPEIELPIPIRYYGQEFSKIYISKDGLLAFSQEVGHTLNEWRNGLPELSSSVDKPFIAPFHHNGHLASTAPQRYTGRIYYDLYKKTTNGPTDVRDREREQFMKDVEEYLSHSVVTVNSFRSEFLLLVTWENVTSVETKNRRGNGSCEATFESPCLSATFQVLLAADRTRTFLVYNYAKMDVPFEPTHLAGMNGGGGRGWTDIVKCVGSCTKKRDQRLLATLPGLTGSDVAGRFIFLVNDDVIVRGGCSPDDRKVENEEAVEAFPRKVHMLGGEVIQVSGRCQVAYSPVYCRFDGQHVTEGRMTSAMRGFCHVPRLTSRGQVKLEVSDNQDRWHVYTYITVIPPDHVGRLRDDERMRPWFEVSPERLSVSWDPHQLSDDRSARVDIAVVGYRETQLAVEWKEDLVKLAEQVENNGVFSFDPSSEERFRCRENCEEYELGVIEIRLREEHTLGGSNARRFFSIGPIPLGWYIHPYMIEYYDGDWPRDKCESWASRELDNVSWRNKLLSCPCTLQQALADWGQWQADVGCSMFKSDSAGRKCSFNKGAKHCVLSVQPTSDGASTHCCYGQDDLLMHTADSFSGSTTNRAHPWGAAPYADPGTIPTMSFWLKDVVPYYYCCVWSGEDVCYNYMNRRPTKDCRHYRQPGSAAVFGDPHVITFDDRPYHFGGVGDFWLVKSPHLHVQARFKEMHNDELYGPGSSNPDLLHPTVISSVVVASPNGDKVTFTLAPPDDIVPRRLDVKVNYRHFFFDKQNQMWQDFKDLSVVNNEISAQDEADRDHSNFTVLMKNGAGVQVAERNRLLHVVVILPPYDKTSTEPASMGLLGTWDENTQNEFMTAQNAIIPVSEVGREKVFYDDFGRQWGVDDQESYFQFPQEVDLRAPRTGSGRDVNPTGNPSDSEVLSVCGTSTSPCARDYYVTRNRTIAMATRKAEEAFRTMRHQQRKMWSCGLLDIPFAEKDNHNYTTSNVVRVIGCREGPGSAGDTQEGPTEYRCVQNETDHLPFWEPEVNPYVCQGVEEANITMIIGIAVGCVVFIIIVIIIVVLIVRSRRKGEAKAVAYTKSDKGREPGTEEAMIKDSYTEVVPRSERKKHEINV